MNSIIIPCYNSEAYLSRCLDSILSQTCTDIELILVNDGSTDNTDQIINDYIPVLMNRISRVIYIRQENQGVGAACNAGFKLATGDTLSLLDSDDYLLAESVEKRSNWLADHPEYGIVRTNGYYAKDTSPDDRESLFEYDEEHKSNPDIFEYVFFTQIVFWPGSYMLRMSMLDNIYPDRSILPSRYGQNFQFLFPIAYISKSGYIDDPLMVYIIRDNSLSHPTCSDEFNKRMNNISGFKEIEYHMIEQFINEEEKQYWTDRFEAFWLAEQMKVAIQYKQNVVRDEIFRKLKKTPNNLAINAKITYFSDTFPPLAYWYRMVRKLMNIISS